MKHFFNARRYFVRDQTNFTSLMTDWMTDKFIVELSSKNDFLDNFYRSQMLNTDLTFSTLKPF